MIDISTFIDPSFPHLTVLFSTFISKDHFSHHIYFLPVASIIPLPKRLQLDIFNLPYTIAGQLLQLHVYSYAGHAIHGGSKLHAMQRGKWSTLLDETIYMYIYI